MDENNITSLMTIISIPNAIVTIDSNMTSNQSASSNNSMPSDLSVYDLPTLPGWVSSLYLTLLCITIGLGIPGNLITALAYFIIKNKTNCDWYIFFVAIFDLISCVFRVTGYLLEFLGVWVQMTNNAYCVFVAWISQTSVCVSIFIFGLVSVERYIKICCDTKLDFTAVQSRNICLVLALVTFILGFPTVFMFGNSPRGLCTVVASSTKESWVKAYYCVMFVLFIGLTVAVSGCYMAIAWTVQKRRRVVGAMPSEHSAKRTPYSLDKDDPGTLPPSTSVPSVDPPNGSDTSSRANAKRHIASIDQPDHAIAKLTVPKLFVVPGPQTKVIVQQINETSLTCSTQVSSSPPPKPKPKQIPTKTGSRHALNIFSQNQYARRQRRDFKITGLLFLVTTIFIISWIPPYYALIKAFFIGYTFPISRGELTTLSLAPSVYIINNFSNPLIYLGLSATYRQKVKHLFTACIRFIKSFSPC